ncbi:Eukaryotic translation initiation factor 3 subunit F [Asimina triloba]
MAAASEQTVLQFFPSSTILTARVHPVVVFSICDCYVRRPDQAERVIGTLLGSISPDGTVDIRNSYAVPHNESSDQELQIALRLEAEFAGEICFFVMKSSATSTCEQQFDDVLSDLITLCRYSTGFGVSGGSALIHDFYSREVANPVHLTVDTGFRNGEASIKAYVSVNLSLGDRQLAAQFNEIPLDLRMVEAERVGFDILKSTMVEKLPNDLEGMEASMERLLALIDDVYKYVDSVVEGHAAPDNTIGRFINDTVASIPKMSPAAFDKLLNDRLQGAGQFLQNQRLISCDEFVIAFALVKIEAFGQDHFLLLYLSSLTRTQLSLAEKLNTAAQIL